MIIRSVNRLLSLIFVATLLAAPVSFAGEKSVRYHHIADLAFVEQYAVIPKRNDVIIIDSRPKARKYDKGHIPGAISIPDRAFKKQSDMLSGKKDRLLIFYCGGQKCTLSHKSAYKAEKLGYSNVKVFADGYPAWVKAGHVAAVSTDYIKSVVDGKKSAVIVDSRPKKRKYDKGHIPAALSIPHRKFDKHVAALPQDKTTPLVFYCGGLKCTLSSKSAKKAQALGYSNVKVYAVGFPAWKKRYAGLVETGTATGSRLEIKQGSEQGTISIDSLQKILKEKPDSILLVDVRDPAEFKAGSLPNAVNIPIDDLEKKVESLPTNKPIVFFCNTGGMSGEAYDIATMFRKDLQAYFVEAVITFKGGGKYEINAS